MTMSGTNHVVTVSTVGSNRTLTFAPSSTVDVASARTLNLTGATAGTSELIISGNIEKTGPGALTFSTGSSSLVQFPGTITVSAGSVGLNAFNTPSLSPHIVLNASGTNLNSLAVTNIQSLSGVAGSNLQSAGANSARGFTITQNTNTTFAGNVGPNPNTVGAAVFNLTKAGTGLLRLSGNVSHDGTTTVSGGTLLINGVYNQDNNGGTEPTTDANVVVASGATLGGTGSIALKFDHAIVLSGILSPGDPAVSGGIGTLTLDFGATTGGFVANSGATFAYDLDTPGVGDLIRFYNVSSGDVVFNNNQIDITDVGGLDAGTYTLMRFYSDSGTTLSDTGKPLSGLTLSPAFLTAYPGSTLDYSATGEIQLVVIPEPASLSVLALAGGALLMRRRV